MTIVGLYTFREKEVMNDPEDREYLRLLGYDTETGDWMPDSDGRKTARIPNALMQAASTPDEAKRAIATVFDGRSHIVAFEEEIPGKVTTTTHPREPDPLTD